MSTFGLSRTPTYGRRQGTFAGGFEMPLQPTVPSAPAGGVGQPFAGMTGMRRPAPASPTLPNWQAVPGALHSALFAALQPFHAANPLAQALAGPGGMTPSRNTKPWWVRDQLVNSGGATGSLMQSLWRILFPGQGGPLDSQNFAAVFGAPSRGQNIAAPTMEQLFSHLLAQPDDWYRYGSTPAQVAQAQNRALGNYATQIGPG